VVVIRDQQITEDEHIRFSRSFGPLELPPHMGLMSFRGPQRPKVYGISNLGPDGEILPADSTRHASNRANEEFHTDSSFNTLPTKWSLLYGILLPPEGGDTQFIDTRAVWDALPDELRSKAEGAVAEHYFWKTRAAAGFPVNDDMRKAMPPAPQPLVRTSASGRKALVIGSHATHLVGWPQQEGVEFLHEINAFAEQPQFIYSHAWRQGDLVIWDNRCTLHRATTYDIFKYKRSLRRTTINEDGPEIASTDLLESAA
jgi:alpha-ketoglutarate-dependent 2,4-dichlorophenoxyacetate dioxygenase